MKSLRFYFTDKVYRSYFILALSALALVASLLDLRPGGVDPAWIAVVLCGAPVAWMALKGFFTRLNIKAGLLVTLALLACIYLDEIFAAGEVAFIMMLGEMLENSTIAKARAGIEKLVHLTPRTARVVREGVEAIIPAAHVLCGETLRVLPGETIPVDGTILEGISAVDQSILTGEPLPMDKTAGDQVFGGSLNQFGALTLRATRVGEDSTLGRMIQLVRSADASKTKIVRLMDRWATWIVLGAVMIAGVTWLVTGELLRAASVLVVFCPCALVLATPTAIVAGIGNLTRYGILVRSGDALERLGSIKGIVFDKTGTLTHGKPEVIAVKSQMPTLSDDRLLNLVARAEQGSEHPLGRAVVAYAKQIGMRLEAASTFVMRPGLGVSALVDGQTILAGKEALLYGQGVDLPAHIKENARVHLENGATPIYVALDGVACGFLALGDTARADARTTISRLKDLGLSPILMTGDGPEAANAVAASVGIDDVYAGCLPEGKLALIEARQVQGQPVAMVGDGINDAPALKLARVGVAMGGVGSDIAVDASDIVLVHDDIKFIPHMVALARRMMATIRLNIVLSLSLNFMGIALAVAGLLEPFWAAIVHNAGSVLVVGNSALLLRWRRYSDPPPITKPIRSITPGLANGSLPEDKLEEPEACCSVCR